MKKKCFFVIALVMLLLNQTNVVSAHQRTVAAYKTAVPFHAKDAKFGGLTSEEEAALRELCLAIWDPSVVNNWNMNDELSYVVVDAIRALGQCDKGMDAILKLIGTLTFQKLSKAVKTVALQIYKMQQLKPGLACKNTVAASYRTAAEMASLGI